MAGLPFIKMHGLGNDFVIVDGRARTPALDPVWVRPEWVRTVADRRTGVGCDQLIVIGASDRADARIDIRNPDGGVAAACGNGTHCVAALLMSEGGAERVVIETLSGEVACRRAGDDLVAADMGPARLEWGDIPLAREAGTLALDLENDDLGAAVAVSMGNPHAVFFVADAEAVDLAALGPGIEHHPLFPDRTNVEVATATAPDRIRLRVWERGTGITRACGSGACATLVAAARRGLTGRAADVVLDGGVLNIVWRDDGHVVMTGPHATSFHGVLDR